MKTFKVELKYEAVGIYEVQAETEQQAEDIAWARLQGGEDNAQYGEWSVESIEEVKE